jgi:hypothetical protein
MSSNVKAACLLFALFAASSQNAYSVTCYNIVDRDNSTIYSSMQPLFSLAGQAWTDGQQRLRVAGQHLLWFDAPTCPGQAFPGATKGAADPTATAVLNAAPSGGNKNYDPPMR